MINNVDLTTNRWNCGYSVDISQIIGIIETLI